MKVPDAWDRLVDEEADKRLDQDDVAQSACEMQKQMESYS